MSRIYTIGHSTRSLEEFLKLLASRGIEVLADVRSIPGSRRYPQFGQEALAQALENAGIEYRWMKDLGGRRHTRKDSPNGAWRNASFRGYADYMLTPEFAVALGELEQLAHKKKTAIMCAEAVPWRCHRSLIGDALLARGWEVLDIISDAPETLHALTPFAQVAETMVTYPPEQEPLV